jgi:hypothetical protein
MKKHFYLLIFFFAITFCGHAQMKKGDILLGGTIGFNSQKSSSSNPSSYEQNATLVNLTPSIGKAIKDNLLVGIDLTWAYIKTTQGSSPDVYTNKSTTYGAGFFLRRYKSLGNGFAIFLQSRLGGSYNTQKDEYESSPNPTYYTKGYAFDLSFYPGIAYAITKRVQLETGFQNLVDANYSHSKTTSATDPNANATTESKSNGFSIQTSLSNNFAFAVGIKVLLGS